MRGEWFEPGWAWASDNSLREAHAKWNRRGRNPERRSKGVLSIVMPALPINLLAGTGLMSTTPACRGRRYILVDRGKPKPSQIGNPARLENTRLAVTRRLNGVAAFIWDTNAAVSR